LDKIQLNKPYAIEYRIMNEHILVIRDNLLQVLSGPGDQESE